MAMPSAKIEVEHLTHYRYAAPVDQAQHLAYLRPRDGAAQQVEAFDLRIEPAPMHRRDESDRLGNARCTFTVCAPHSELRVCARSRVTIDVEPDFDAGTSLPWEAVREGLRYVAGASFEPASEFLYASPYIPLLPALRALALPSFTPGRPVAQAAIDLMARIHERFAYRSASTEVDTPLAEVLTKREGVCQDFAHVAIGALRAMGLAAHYISGYLLTVPSHGAGGAPLLGADASHAWLAVWCPLAGDAPARWLELDPTNNLLPGQGHIRLAIGRDYGDVTPLRGVIRGGGEHRLEVRVRTAKLA